MTRPISRNARATAHAGNTDARPAAEDLGRARVAFRVKTDLLYIDAWGERQAAADDYQKYLTEFRRRLAEYVRDERGGAEDFPPIPYRPIDER